MSEAGERATDVYDDCSPSHDGLAPSSALVEGRREQRARVPEPRSGITAIDVVFGLFVAITAVLYFRWTNGFWFSSDDWPLALRGHTAGDFLEPFNKHLSIVIIAIYRGLYGIFGMDNYVPWRIVGIACLLSVPVALYLVMRNRVSPLIAALVAALFLWFPSTELHPSLLNHFLAALGGIVCAWALTRSDRTGDIVVAVTLTFSLCAATGGLAVAAACIVYAACTHAHRWRWFAVGVPPALWAVWYFALGRIDTESHLRLSAYGMLRNSFEGILRTFESLAFGNSAAGALLLSAFTVHLVWRLTQGIVRAGNALAWTAALVVWWAGLAYSRGILIDPEAYRYVFVSGVFVVLALIPPEPLALPKVDRRARGTVAVVLAFGAVALVNHSSVEAETTPARFLSNMARLHAVVANLGPEIVPDDFLLPWMAINGEQYHRIVDRLGYPAGTRPENVDARLVELTGVRVVPKAAGEPCTANVSTTFTPASALVRVQNGAAPTTVSVLRFSEAPTEIGRLGPNQSATVALPRILTDDPWAITAPGACLTLIEPTG